MSQLTYDQEQALVSLIDTWYEAWKDDITESGEPHYLGTAKEDLNCKKFIRTNHEHKQTKFTKLCS